MDHLKSLIRQLERDNGVRQTPLRRTFNKLVGGKQLVGAFHNKSKDGKPDVYPNAFAPTDPIRPENCEQACKDKSSKYFLLHNRGRCGCATEFDGEHGEADWEWEYGNSSSGGSKKVNIVYNMEEEEQSPKMIGCVKIGKKPKNSNHAYIVFGKKFKDHRNFFNLSKKADLKEAASNLYKTLRIIKKKGFKRIYVSKIPKVGPGLAINDRLMRASK